MPIVLYKHIITDASTDISSYFSIRQQKTPPILIIHRSISKKRSIWHHTHLHVYNGYHVIIAVTSLTTLSHRHRMMTLHQQNGPLPAILSPLTRVASIVFGWIVAKRNQRYNRAYEQLKQTNDKTSSAVKRVPIPVISVGNITVGGTGKTPMVSWIVDCLIHAGHKPIIAMRGYKAKPGQPGDEQLEHQTAHPDVPVIANPDRTTAINKFLHDNQKQSYDCVVLDDGFQHRKLYRDLDIVLIDATRPPFDSSLLPNGWLREPCSNLERADAVVFTHADLKDDDRFDYLRLQVAKYHGKSAAAGFAHAWSHLLVREPNEDLANENNDDLTIAQNTKWQTQTVPYIAKRRVLVACAIGNPAAFIDQLEYKGAIIVGAAIRKDHEPFTNKDLITLDNKAIKHHADAIVMTNKDWFKIQHAAHDATNNMSVTLIRPQLKVEPVGGADTLRKLILNTVA